MNPLVLQRESETALVTGALDAARDGRGEFVLITGSLGVGKSALLHEMANLAGHEEFRVLRASAALMEQGFAFGVVRQLFEAALVIAGDEVRERWFHGAADLAAPVFATDCPPVDDPWQAETKPVVLHGLHVLAANMSAEQPLLILVDDLQWADEASLRWLGYLAKRLERLGIVVVGTLRDGDPHCDRALVRQLGPLARHTLRPAPLSPSSIRRIVLEQCGEEGEEEFVEACHDYTGGNPLLLRGVLATLSCAGHRPIAATAETARSTMPTLLRERLVACLRSQPEPALKLVKSISVLGEQVDRELIGRLAGLDRLDCDETLRSLERQGLVTTDPRTRLAHLTVQDATEQSMTAEERERLHVSAATLLHGAGYPAEDVASHLLGVSSPQEQWAVAALRSAAGQALRRGEPETAVRYLRRALLNASADGENRAKLLVDLAMAERAFDLQASIRHLAQAVPLLASVRERAEALVGIAPTALSRAPVRVVDLVRQVADELGDPARLSGRDRELGLRLQARAQYSRDDDPVELKQAAGRLQDLRPDDHLGSAAERELLAVLLHAASVTIQLPAAEVARLADRIFEREPASPAHVHTALPLVVINSIAADSTVAVASWLDTAMEHALHQRNSLAQAVIHTEKALLLISNGRVPEAKVHALDALAITGTDWHELKIVGAALATVATELRDDYVTEQVFARCRGLGEDSPLAAGTRILSGIQAAERGELTVALEYLVDCGQQLDRAGWRNPMLLPWRVWALALHHRQGDQRAARELADEEYARAREWGAPAAVGRGLRLRGMVAGDAEGIPLLREAVSVLQESANALELGRTHVLLGRRLLAAGDDQAEEHLRQGKRLADLCGVRWLAERATPGMRTAPPVLVRRPVLTPTERRVARFAARGVTNQEIATELGVSRRAVEKHLTNSYRKLNTSGRDGLVEALRSADDSAT